MAEKLLKYLNLTISYNYPFTELPKMENSIGLLVCEIIIDKKQKFTTLKLEEDSKNRHNTHFD